ncbi:MAG: sulfatase-like hydrolase/transferase [Thiolinea sp.]
MENHGPLHLESASPEEWQQYYYQPPPAQHDDLTIYLRHLCNADRMLGQLQQRLSVHERSALLCFYGDHVPSMPQVYGDLAIKDGRTDYLIWSNDDKCTHARPESQPDKLAHSKTERDVAELGPLLLDQLTKVR